MQRLKYNFRAHSKKGIKYTLVFTSIYISDLACGEFLENYGMFSKTTF